MIYGVDYSVGVPSVASLKAAGVAFVARYVSPGARRKDLTRAEADAMRAAGIDVVTVYEDTVGDARAGRGGGRANATFAAAELPRLGAPDNAPCYFAVDYEAQGAEVTMAVDYVRGAADVLGAARTGVYGSFRVVQACLDAEACTYAWQTTAWSGGRWDDRAQIQQHLRQVVIDGVTCDRNFATQPDYGQWDREEQDMPLSDDDLAKVRRVIREELSGFYDTLVDGDATHPVTLRAILKAAGVTVTDAQAELIGGRILAALQVGRLKGTTTSTTEVAVELGPE